MCEKDKQVAENLKKSVRAADTLKNGLDDFLKISEKDENFRELNDVGLLYRARHQIEELIKELNAKYEKLLREMQKREKEKIGSSSKNVRDIGGTCVEK